MRMVRVVVLMAITGALAPVFDFPAPRKKTARRGGIEPHRQITARLVGDAYAPKSVFRPLDPDNLRPMPSTDNPRDHGRALLRRAEISKAIPELREAARNADPAALTDLAAALLSDQEWLFGHPRERVTSRGDPSSRYRPSMDAITMLRRAIEREPGLAAAHFNLALALDHVGLAVDAQTEFHEAIRRSSDIEWNREARQHAERVRLSELAIDRDRINAYVAVTGHSAGRHLLRPYLEAQKQRLGRSPLPGYPDSRFSLAADTVSYGVHSADERLMLAMQAFCPRATAEPCAMRYYTAGALYVAGRKSEAAAWLHSVDDEIQQTHGSAGMRALQRWEEGLNLVVRGSSRSALEIFEAQYAEHWASDQPVLAAAFDDLRRTVRGYLVSEALFRRDIPAAFHYADGSSLQDVQSVLASDAAILRYVTTISEQMMVFVVRRDSVDLVQLHRSPHLGPEWDAAVATARMRTAEDSAFGPAAALLHDLVFAPVLEKLRGISTVAVIRNFELAEISFGALFDAEEGKYAAERFTIVHAPSAHAAVELSKRARAVDDPTLLAIGATEFDRTQGDLIPAVDREIAEITRQSLCARVFSGKQATPDAIERALAENAVIHFGGHIVRRGADLRLLLAPSRGRDSLSAQEIAALRLDKARVVVLAACGGAASGDPYAMIRTVADAFVIAGVPTVIATSYDVDDAEAPRTMRLLHTFLRNGHDAAEALRQTTLIELRSGRAVPLSIRFQAVGGASALIQ
jgi:CHAT domain-containing protein